MNHKTFWLIWINAILHCELVVCRLVVCLGLFFEHSKIRKADNSGHVVESPRAPLDPTCFMSHSGTYESDSGCCCFGWRIGRLVRFDSGKTRKPGEHRRKTYVPCDVSNVMYEDNYNHII